MTSDVDGWLAALERIRTLDIDYIAPGHGPVQGRTISTFSAATCSIG
jgi:glyoxylase-like metal-dependent hydrolase (beta-lactamase superfamily II)